MSDHYWIDGNGTRRRNCCDSTYDRTHFDDCPRHRERAGMNRLTEAERVLGLDVSASMPGRWYAEEVVEAIVAARLASVEALHVQDDREGHDECVGCRDECLYCEGDHVWPCPTIRVLGSDAHTEQHTTQEDK